MATGGQPSPSGVPIHPPPFIMHPRKPYDHEQTIVLLHGTSTSGPEFAESFLNFKFPAPYPRTNGCVPRTPASNPQTSDPATIEQAICEHVASVTLPDLLQTTRFVFPTGSLKKTTVFGGRETNAWFDIHDFSDRTIKECEQAPQITESLFYLKALIREENALLQRPTIANGGKKERKRDRDARKKRRVVLGGFSQGCAMGIICVLSGELSGKSGIEAFVGISGWLPYRERLISRASCLGSSAPSKHDVPPISPVLKERIIRRVRDVLKLPVDVRMGKWERFWFSVERMVGGRTRGGQLGLMVPVWLGHGEEDVKVRLEWGMQMAMALRGADIKVTSKTYAELEHWYSEQEMSDIVAFLGNLWQKSGGK